MCVTNPYSFIDSDTLSVELIQEYGLTQATAEHLVRTYGGRAREVCRLDSNPNKLLCANYPYLESEVKYACREYACTIEDVLSRRTRLAFLNREAALTCIPRVAEIMAKELKWSSRVKTAQMQAARSYIESYGGTTPMDEPK